jgi:hypothetical protein
MPNLTACNYLQVFQCCMPPDGPKYFKIIKLGKKILKLWEKWTNYRFKWQFISYVQLMTVFCSIYHHISTAFLTQ